MTLCQLQQPFEKATFACVARDVLVIVARKICVISVDGISPQLPVKTVTVGPSHGSLFRWSQKQ